jgi:phospholipid/cholesterol/gamma-HCH transport system substrate-binding protein
MRVIGLRPAALRRAALRLGAVVVVAGLATASCSYIGVGSRGGYVVTAYFHEAVALYPHSKVKVMGVSAGTVERVAVDGSRVRVDMRINNDVPLPTHISATIDALTIIGERNIILSPPWRPGDDKVPNHFVIPLDHTTTPVEPDDALKAITDLAHAIDPAVVTGLITNGANAFGGHAQSFNDLLGGTATLSQQLAQQDDQIIQTAKNLHQLAGTLDTRQQQLGHVIDGFSQATGTLADERAVISSILAGANQLVSAGTSLLAEYKGTLPGDIANLARLGLTLQANVGVFSQLIGSFPAVAQGLLNAYNTTTRTIQLGANLDPSIAGILDGTLGRILNRLGLGNLLPCIQIPNWCP